MQGGQGASPLAVGGCDLAREKIVSCRIPALGFKQEIAGYGCRYGASSSAMGHNDRTGIAWPTDGRESDRSEERRVGLACGRRWRHVYHKKNHTALMH